MDVALSRRGSLIVLELCPDIAASILALTVRGCLLPRGLSRVMLLEASLACKEPSPGGTDKQAREPFGPGAGGVSCLVVSHPLCDPTVMVASKASHPLNE